MHKFIILQFEKDNWTRAGWHRFWSKMENIHHLGGISFKDFVWSNSNYSIYLSVSQTSILLESDFPRHTGCTIKNGYQRKWFYTLAGGINQKSVVTTFVLTFIGVETNSSYSIWWPSILAMVFNWLEAKTYLEVSPITTQYVFVSSISVVWGKSLQISQATQICKIYAFASNQLKIIAKIEGHQME